MAHKKGGGSTRNGRDSIGKRLGVKKFSGNYVTAGSILARQRGRIYMLAITSGLATIIRSIQKSMDTYGSSEKTNIAGR